MPETRDKTTPLRYLRLLLVGVPEPIVYVVSAAQHDTFRRFADHADPDDPDADFFAFDTCDGFEVIVSTDAIQAAHLFREHDLVPEAMETDWARNRARETIRLFLAERAAPIEMRVSEPGEIAMVFANLDAAGLDAGRFQWWQDRDEAEFFVNVEQIVLLEVPAHLVEAGRQKLEAEASKALRLDPRKPARNRSVE
ncbi:MAG: hypothetical protein HY815_18895 [Candidatus Riflebacteria bacterium]|nr:hypothetical protein [Candidatus Riflebacteria bacterium]